MSLCLPFVKLTSASGSLAEYCYNHNFGLQYLSSEWALNQVESPASLSKHRGDGVSMVCSGRFQSSNQLLASHPLSRRSRNCFESFVSLLHSQMISVRSCFRKTADELRGKLLGSQYENLCYHVASFQSVCFPCIPSLKQFRYQDEALTVLVWYC